MTEYELYDAIGGLDEKFLTEKEKIKKSIHKRKVISKTAVLLTFCICIVAAGTFLIKNMGENPNTAPTDKLATEPIGLHGGDGEPVTDKGNENIYPESKIPPQLLVSGDLTGEVKYLSSIFPTDDYSEEYDREKMLSDKEKRLKGYMYALGEKTSEITYENEIFPCCTHNGTKIMSFSNHIGVDTFLDIHPSSSDDEIISALKENVYASALMAYIGLDADKLFIYRDTAVLSGEDESGSAAKITYFNICTYSESPQQLSLNLSSNYIRLWITEDESEVSYSLIYGYFAPKGSETVLTDYVPYSEAVKTAEERSEEFSKDKLLSCVIDYSNTIIKGKLMPLYRFVFLTESGEKTVEFPLKAE